MTKEKSLIWVLLNLSAAFDRVDQEILLSQRETDVGVSGVALSWFRCYVSGRSQSVSCHGPASQSRTFTYGVPQGSDLGPLLICDYLRPLDLVLENTTPAIISMLAKLTCNCLSILVIQVPADNRLNNCLADIRSCMSENFLKLNVIKLNLSLLVTQRG